MSDLSAFRGTPLSRPYSQRCCRTGCQQTSISIDPSSAGTLALTRHGRVDGVELRAYTKIRPAEHQHTWAVLGDLTDAAFLLLTMECPLTLTSPPLGTSFPSAADLGQLSQEKLTTPRIQANVVLFPAPFGPICHQGTLSTEKETSLPKQKSRLMRPQSSRRPLQKPRLRHTSSSGA